MKVVQSGHDLDTRCSSALYKLGLNVPRSVWKSLEFTGDGIVWLVFTIIALLLPKNDDYTRAFFANLLLGLLVDLAATGVLKFACKRKRPKYNVRANDMKVVVSVDHYSFPSGHSSRAFFVACYVSLQLWMHNRILCSIIWLWAGTLATSRVAMGRHYVGDIVAGACIGVLNCSLICKGNWQPRSLILPLELVSYAHYTLLNLLKI